MIKDFAISSSLHSWRFCWHAMAKYMRQSGEFCHRARTKPKAMQAMQAMFPLNAWFKSPNNSNLKSGLRSVSARRLRSKPILVKSRTVVYKEILFC